jgi:hypothetical protein
MNGKAFWMLTLRKWLLGMDRRPLSHLWLAVTVIVSTGFLLRVQWRIVTYACGNDPMLYMRAARVLLSPTLYGPESVCHALTFVAPGYPAILAACISLFGSLSPPWLNVFLLIASVPLMWRVFRRLMGSDRAASLSVLGFFLMTET